VTTAVLSLGSNLGDRLGNLRLAVEALGDAALVVSPVYETPPWGGAGQPAYLNAAVLVAAPVPAATWLAWAHQIEAAGGRVREPGRRYGPRTVDVDVIAVWDDAGVPILSDDPELTLPHPRAHLRAFVLRPWVDIRPYGELPGHGRLVDLLRTAPVAADLPDVRECPDVTLL